MHETVVSIQRAPTPRNLAFAPYSNVTESATPRLLCSLRIDTDRHHTHETKKAAFSYYAKKKKKNRERNQFINMRKRKIFCGSRWFMMK